MNQPIYAKEHMATHDNIQIYAMYVFYMYFIRLKYI